MKKPINKLKDNFLTKTGESLKMNQDEISRWSCLIEAVEFINKKGDQIGMDMNKGKWVKPIAIQKYIDERFDTMSEELEHEANNHPIDIYS